MIAQEVPSYDTNGAREHRVVRGRRDTRTKNDYYTFLTMKEPSFLMEEALEAYMRKGSLAGAGDSYLPPAAGPGAAAHAPPLEGWGRWWGRWWWRR